MNNKNNYKSTSGASILMFIAFLFFVLWISNRVNTQENELTYKSFVEAVEADEVTDASISPNKEVPTGVVTVRLEGDTAAHTVNVSDVTEVESLLKEHDIDYEMENVPQETWVETIIFPSLITLAGVFLIFMLMNRQGGNANSKAMSSGRAGPE